MRQDKSVGERLWAIAVWALVIFFVVNVIATIAAVAVDSFGTLVQFVAAGRLHDALVQGGVG